MYVSENYSVASGGVLFEYRRDMTQLTSNLMAALSCLTDYSDGGLKRENYLIAATLYRLYPIEYGECFCSSYG